MELGGTPSFIQPIIKALTRGSGIRKDSQAAQQKGSNPTPGSGPRYPGDHRQPLETSKYSFWTFLDSSDPFDEFWLKFGSHSIEGTRQRVVDTKDRTQKCAEL